MSWTWTGKAWTITFPIEFIWSIGSWSFKWGFSNQNLVVWPSRMHREMESWNMMVKHQKQGVTPGLANLKMWMYSTRTEVFHLDELQPFPLRLLRGFIWMTWQIMDQFFCFRIVLIYSNLTCDPQRMVWRLHPGLRAPQINTARLAVWTFSGRLVDFFLSAFWNCIVLSFQRTCLLPQSDFFRALRDLFYLMPKNGRLDWKAAVFAMDGCVQLSSSCCSGQSIPRTTEAAKLFVFGEKITFGGANLQTELLWWDGSFWILDGSSKLWCFEWNGILSFPQVWHEERITHVSILKTSTKKR